MLKSWRPEHTLILTRTQAYMSRRYPGVHLKVVFHRARHILERVVATQKLRRSTGDSFLLFVPLGFHHCHTPSGQMMQAARLLDVMTEESTDYE